MQIFEGALAEKKIKTVAEFEAQFEG